MVIVSHLTIPNELTILHPVAFLVLGNPSQIDMVGTVIIMARWATILIFITSHLLEGTVDQVIIGLIASGLYAACHPVSPFHCEIDEYHRCKWTGGSCS